MAIIAIRAAIAARKRKEKLVEKAQSMTSTTLEPSDRRFMLERLKMNENTAYLSNLAEAEKDAEIKLESSDEGQQEPDMLPPVKPYYISQAHYDYLRQYFYGDVDYDPTWMKAYYRTRSKEPCSDPGQDIEEDYRPDGGKVTTAKSLEETKEEQPASLNDIIGSIQSEPDDPVWILRYNEFVLQMQVLLVL